MIDHYFYKKYIEEGKKLGFLNLISEKAVGWESPSNIALIKYWGKFGNQLPQNPSISFTLSQSVTRTKITIFSIHEDKIDIQFYFNYQHNTDFENRIFAYFSNIIDFFPFLKGLRFEIESYNSFPHSAGIASSASSMSAIALCLCSIERDHFKTLTNDDEFYTKASFIARLGSGSACRSIFGPVVLWGSIPEIDTSSNEIAIPINEKIHPVFKSYHDTILVIDSGSKAISSSMGHDLMKKHNYATARYAQAKENLKELLVALESGNELGFSNIVENEALSLHGLLFSSSPFQVLLHPNTLSVIKKIREFKAATNLNFAFTLDAGPNIHILYSDKIKKDVMNFVDSGLKQFCENELWIDDKLANGPKEIS